MSSYPFGEVLEYQNIMRGLPNTTCKVVTERRVIALRVYGRGQSSLEHIELELRVLQHLASMDFESPRLLAGTDGQILQQWNGYWVCATEFIPGETADAVTLTPELVGDVGRLAASFQKAMESFKIDTIPEGGTLIERGLGGLTSLDAALRRRGWEMDIRNVGLQWERASGPFSDNCAELNCNIIHADMWPSNVICQGDKVVGLVDFDDRLYGATLVDVAIAQLEFSMVQDLVVDEDLTIALLGNFFRHGGTLSPLEEDLIVDAIEVMYVIWLAYYVSQSPYYEEAATYLYTLNLLSDDAFREGLCADIARCIRKARASS